MNLGKLPPNEKSGKIPPGFQPASMVVVILLLIFALYMQLRGAVNLPATIPGEVTETVSPAPPTSTIIADPTVTLTFTPEPSPTIQPTPTAQFGQSFVIGYSENGLPLEVFQFGNGPKERMIVAGIHGGYEWNTVALADELMGYLMNDPSLVPPEITLYILRNLNPDGYARGRGAEGRANANGVDLNRNFDANWAVDWSRDVCFNRVYVTGGPEPGSEPETQAFMAFVKSRNLEALINYHSAGLGIFPGGDPPGPKSQLLAYFLSQLSPYAYPPKDIGCVYTGQLVNWMVLQGVPAVDIELSTHGYTDFEINKRILEFFLRLDLELEGS